MQPVETQKGVISNEIGTQQNAPLKRADVHVLGHVQGVGHF